MMIIFARFYLTTAKQEDVDMTKEQGVHYEVEGSAARG